MKTIRKALSVVFGSLFVGIGVNLFLVPHRLLDGGMIGIGLLAKYYLGLPPGMVMLLVSLPVYAAVFVYDRKLFYHSFHGLILSSWMIDAFSPLRHWGVAGLPESAVIGGGLIGAGIGLMLAHNTNTGGTDLLAQFIAKRTQIPVAVMIFLIDGLIVLLAVQAIGGQKTLFSLLTILCVAVATHLFLRWNQPRPPWHSLGSVSSFLENRNHFGYNSKHVHK